MKKLSAIVVALVMASFLAGCSNCCPQKPVCEKPCCAEKHPCYKGEDR